ncbi:MAG: lysophospholipid acyltransferase family protein [Chloroflexota bacterium]
MNFIRGYYRLTLVALLLCFWGLLVVIASWFPIKVKDVPLAGWMTYGAARSLAFVLGFHVHCEDKSLLRNHEGYLFTNHVSFMDIVVLVCITPLRFVAKIETLKVPIIGQAAKGIQCVFVDRSNKASRTEARKQLANIEKYPAIAIYPEGTRSTKAELLPFRHGAFEIAIEGEDPILPCGIAYDPPEAVIWPNKGLIAGGWRLASRYRRVDVYLHPLETIYPKIGDDPAQMADEMREKMTAVIYPDQT